MLLTVKGNFDKLFCDTLATALYWISAVDYFFLLQKSSLLSRPQNNEVLKQYVMTSNVTYNPYLNWGQKKWKITLKNVLFLHCFNNNAQKNRFVDSETWLTSPMFSLPPPLSEFLLSSTSSLKKTSLTSVKPLLVGSIRASRMELM